MATRTNPLMTVAALATAATVAVATPALAPSITTATPPALSSAKVELATFADLLSIPGSESAPQPDLAWVTLRRYADRRPLPGSSTPGWATSSAAA